MTNLLFLTQINLNRKNGYSNKVNNQIKTLGKFVSVCSIFIVEDGLILRKHKNDQFDDVYLFKIKNKVIKIFLLPIFGLKTCLALKIMNVYVRRIIPNNLILIGTLLLLRIFKIRVLYEYPTYPYKEENKKFNFILKINEEVLAFFINTLVEKLIIISSKNIEGPKFIEITNGINVSDYEIVENYKKKNIEFIAVAYFNDWHGYDRLIEGINDYKRKINEYSLKIHFVGDGPAKNDLLALTKKYKLEKEILFHGELNGKELDSIFNRCNIAVGSLGLHRIGIDKGAILKAREYAARGIPFIISYFDPLFDNEEFVIKVPANNEPIEVEKILEFLEDFVIKPMEIRKIADQKCNWEIAMANVINYLK